MGPSVALAVGRARAPPLTPYLLDAPRASFFTLRFCDPRAYSRGLSGFSAFRFLRDARFVFLRSSLLRVLVLAMNALAFLSIVFSATNAN